MIETLEANGYIGFGDAITTERLTTPADWEAQGMAAGASIRCESLVHADWPFRPRNLWVTTWCLPAPARPPAWEFRWC
jgi:phytoene desaturase